MRRARFLFVCFLRSLLRSSSPLPPLLLRRAGGGMIISREFQISVDGTGPPLSSPACHLLRARRSGHHRVTRARHRARPLPPPPPPRPPPPPPPAVVFGRRPRSITAKYALTDGRHIGKMATVGSGWVGFWFVSLRVGCGSGRRGSGCGSGCAGRVRRFRFAGRPGWEIPMN